ncbi:MAG: beta-galactosidase [Clostridiales bacterium]|nr:beta-galactosidase [Clostridiales bacterium]
MRIGVDYYPEHWDRAFWAQDADLMKKTGVKLVRLAEFAWCRLEPREGEFDFAWLDEAVALFAARGIDVVLCTPTSCPPLWLYEKHPDAVMVEKDGSLTRTGIRGHRCINHPAVRKYSQRIIERMTEHYAGNKAVVAWQIDNELEAYFCFCETCNARFRHWLKKKYGTLEALNRAYGNVVWSGEYSSWEQIQPPYGHYPDAWMNPAFMLDYSRFASENVIGFSDWQAEIIRRKCPGLPVTTNVWFCGHMPDFYRQFENLDFIAYDNYPTTRLPEDPEECYTHAFHLDMMRGVKRGGFWVMEQLSGGMGCWAPMARMPEPGMIKGYALQAFAHGADTVVHFRWRTANIGAEMHWHGLIDHSNVPGRRFDEFADLCREAETLHQAQGAEIRADVAILFSFENEYAFKIQPQTNGYYYLEQLQRLHAAFTRLGMNVDIIGQHESLEGYRIVCAPEMYVTDMNVVRRLHDFAAQGGTVILTTRSGVKDENNNAIMAQLPTVYRDMVGAFATEYDPIGYDHVPVCFADGAKARGRQWCDVLETEGAQALACYDGEYFRGKAAVTRNGYGKGVVYYIGTVGDQALYDKLVRDAVTEAALEFIPGLPAHVEVTTRKGDGCAFRFIFNNAGQEQRFTLDGVEITLAPFEMKVITIQRTDC